MAREHCGKFRDRHGNIHSPPPKEHGQDLISYIKVYEEWMKEWDDLGIENTRCACDPEHPHAPVEDAD